MNKFIKPIFEKIKGPKMLVIIGIIGIILIGLSSFFPTESDKKEISVSSFDIEEYRNELQYEISDLVKDITGSKSCTVVITLESGVRYTYADTSEKESSSSSGEKNEENSSSSSKSYITVKNSDGSERPLLITEIMPKVRGVAIVCDCGDDEAIKENIIASVTAALDISSKKINVSGGNSYEKG